jgi:uncharacterized repeat protein (TIGR03943 family)
MRDRAFSLLPGLLGALLAWQLLSGHIFLYVHERSFWLVALSVPLLVAMSLASLRRGAKSGLTGWLLILPIAIGLLVPARPLGSEVLAGQIGGARLPIWEPRVPLSLDTSSRVWDLKQLGLLEPDDADLARRLEGQRAHLVGFVHRTQSLPPDRFLVGRFVVRCCAVDAVGISFPVRYDGAANLARDAWVEVDGSIHAATPDANTPVVDADQVRLVAQPTQPYLTLP